MASWAEQQINFLISIGDSPQDAEQFVREALYWIPEGTDPDTYFPTVSDVQALSVSTAEDVMDARVDWYASDDVPADLKRLLDATLVQEGGPGSGHMGHLGRPGHVRGSMPGMGGGFVSRDKELADAFNNPPGVSLEASWTIGKEEKWLYSQPGQRAAVKAAICARLAEDMGISEEEASSLIKSWAHTSNDESADSLGIQNAAAQVFGAELTGWQQKRWLANEPVLDAKIRLRQAEDQGVDASTLRFLRQGVIEAQGKSALQQQYVQAVYSRTQLHLASLGIGTDDTITLYRGMRLRNERTPPNLKVGGRTRIQGNMLESWSINSDDVAKGFAEIVGQGRTGIVVKAQIPRRLIISTALTGFGCLGEGEVVIRNDKSISAEVTYLEEG